MSQLVTPYILFGVMEKTSAAIVQKKEIENFPCVDTEWLWFPAGNPPRRDSLQEHWPDSCRHPGN